MPYSLYDIDAMSKTPRHAFMGQYEELYPEVCDGDIDLIAIKRGGIGALNGLVQLVFFDTRINTLSINPHNNYQISGNPRTDRPWLLCDDTYRSGKTACRCAERLLLEGYNLECGYVYSAFDMKIRRIRDILSAC